MAAILRRHFAYASLALIETVALYGLVRAIAALPAGKGRWREEARATLLWLVVAGAAAGGTLLTVGHGFMRRVIAIDFSVLYKSYENAITVALLSFLKPYGWANLMAASAGLLFSLRAGVAERGRVVFLTLFAVISGLQWLLAVPQVGEQYTLHFTPIVVMGLLMFGWSLWRRANRAWRPVLAVAACVWLVTNAVLSLSTLKFGKDAVWRPLLAAQWEPLRRYDYNAVLDLVQVLAEHGPPRARVYVAASSHVINSDIVRHADWARVRSTTSRLAVLRAPELDARDEYPVSTLVQADMVATADPLQYHLSPGAQTTVRAVHDIFAQDVAVARDFERLPAVFPFLDGVAVTVFKRVRPTTLDTALETLRIAREYTPRRPGMQPDWVTVGGPFPSWLDRLHRDRVKWVAHPVKRGYAPATALCSLDAPRAVTRLSAQVTFTDRRCPGAALIFSILDAGGRRRPLAEVRARSGEDGRFDLRLETRGAQHLLLELESYDQATSIDYCLLDVRLRTYTAGKPGE
jgi:hypothetical protein